LDSQDELGGMSSFQFSKNLTIEPDIRGNSVVICGSAKDIEIVESIVNQIAEELLPRLHLPKVRHPGQNLFHSITVKLLELLIWTYPEMDLE
jgi:hypothetical protein